MSGIWRGILNWNDIFDYNPATGDLIWKIHRKAGSKSNIGDVAGNRQKRGYLYIWISGVLYMAHRIVWEMHNGKIGDGMVIDHLNHIPYDNRIENLRITTQLSNTRNNKRSKANTSGTTGVMWREKEGKWLASITVGRKRIYLGRFNDKISAVEARKLAEIKYGFHDNHGEELQEGL